MRKVGRILITVVFIIFLYNFFSPILTSGVYVSGWGSSSKQPTPPEKLQEIKFDATVINERSYPVFISNVEALFNDSVKDNFVRGDQKVRINQWLKPGETKEINGEWVFDTTGIKEKNIMQVSNCVYLKVNKFPF
ncbi:hypothetical protein [Ammoniphilus sp. YIM 78166]|uniref:hypothetical protein n=1 Tax=Ammoniphilus sp. YIM 78166 TaxID=1644106 RepID=UPI00106F8EA5|nr:hypothetical protein [Ammoniphilus sp. YIM 78166]